MPSGMPRNVRGTSRVPHTGSCQMCRSLASPGRIHSTPQPVHVAAPDVVRREDSFVVERGVTVLCGTGAAGADTEGVRGDAGGALAGADEARAGAGGGVDADVPIHVGCEPEGFAGGPLACFAAAAGLVMGALSLAGAACFAGAGAGLWAGAATFGAGGGAGAAFGAGFAPRFGSWMIEGNGFGAGADFGAGAGFDAAAAAGTPPPPATFLMGTAAAAPAWAPACDWFRAANGNWKIRAGSWDRFQIPLPFARCDVVIGKPILVPREATDEQRAELRQKLQQTLREISKD